MGRPHRRDRMSQLTSAEHDLIVAGLTQRASLIELMLRDLYGERELIRAGIVPGEMVFSDPQFVPSAWSAPRGQKRLLLACGFTLTRASTGWTLVNTTADTPLAEPLGDSRAVHTAIKEEIAHRYADGVVVALASTENGAFTPNHESFAHHLGIRLVGPSSLTVHSGSLVLNDGSQGERVDAVLRLIPSLEMDPLDIRAQAAFAVSGISATAHRGAVTIANPIGAGAVENPALESVMDDVARFFFDEPLHLSAPRTIWFGNEDEREEALSRPENFTFTHRSGALSSIPTNSRDDDTQQLLAAIREKPWDWYARETAEPSAESGSNMHAVCVLGEERVQTVLLTASETASDLQGTKA